MRKIFSATGATLAVIALAACGSSAHSSRTVSPSQSAAIATVRAEAHAYLARCVPADAAHQILLGKSLLGSDGRSAFAACLAIPPANRKDFEAALLAAAEKVKWTSKDQRHAFVTVTLPALVVRYHGVNPQADIPGVTVPAAGASTP